MGTKEFYKKIFPYKEVSNAVKRVVSTTPMGPMRSLIFFPTDLSHKISILCFFMSFNFSKGEFDKNP